MGCCVNEVEADRMKPSFLVVDDQPENLDVIIATLAPEGFDLRVAISGPAAIELAGEMIPDLILLDMHLPGASGYEVVERLKADGRTQRIPVIAITSDAMADDEERARKAGCDDYVAKPYRPPQLLDAIRRHLTC